MRKNLLKSLVAGAVVFAASASANAFVMNIGGNDYTFDQIDWSSGGTVWSPDYNPAAGVGTDFKLYYMTEAAALKQGNLTAYSFDKATSPFELTLYVDVTETIASDNGFGTQTFSMKPGGIWKIFQDAANNANLNTGLGVTDGTNILSGSFFPGPSGSFTASSLLDGFGVEALFGSVDGTPNGTITPQPVGTTAVTTLQAGVFSTGWTAPTGFANGIDGGTNPLYVQNSSQLKLQGDANQTLFVPEPASMALVGLGLTGLAALRRRK